ncbi:MAG: glycosyltransferase family 2 protein [Acidimicrobiales bacterium]
MTASVVVVSWRPGDWLAPCLGSVAAQADQVLVVDNGSEGSAASAIARQAGAEVVRSAVNLGFAPAVNLGAARARGDLLGLLNDDAVAGGGWLAGAARALQDPTVAGVGPKVVLSGRYREVVLPDEQWRAPGDERALGRQLRSVRVGDVEVLERAAGPGLHRTEGVPGDRWRWTAGPRPWYVPLLAGEDGAEVLVDGEPVAPGRVVRLVNSAGSFIDRRGYGGDIGADTADDGGYDEPAERFAISGSAFVTRAETWRQVGAFAAPYFAYYEDLDWCWRARLAGMRLLYDPSATIEHRRSATSGGEHDSRVRVMAERNRTLTMVRNGPRHLALKALRDRAGNGPDGGVREAIVRLLPWGVATRLALSRRWRLQPEEVWSRWAGEGASGSP